MVTEARRVSINVRSTWRSSAHATRPGVVRKRPRQYPPATSVHLDRRPRAKGQLLADPRRTYLAAQEAEILWATLLRGAKGVKDRTLIDIVEPAASCSVVGG